MGSLGIREIDAPHTFECILILAVSLRNNRYMLDTSHKLPREIVGNEPDM